MSTQTHRSGAMSSHTQEPLATIRHSIVVPVPVEAAFTAFTGQFDRIKPREHNLLGVEIAETVFEQRVGGSLYDRGVDGSECRWARVLAYDPPQRIVISWDISPQWQIETDHERTSEVEIRFVADGEDRTTVQLEHRNLDRHGDGWQMFRDAIAGDGGWPLYLHRFAELTAPR
jgi:uncharacterized protein YndB with AHSA1/START domain